MTSTLKFDLLLKNFNLGHNLQTKRDRAYLLHIHIPCDKSFPSISYFWSDGKAILDYGLMMYVRLSCTLGLPLRLSLEFALQSRHTIFRHFLLSSWPQPYFDCFYLVIYARWWGSMFSDYSYSLLSYSSPGDYWKLILQESVILQNSVKFIITEN